MSQSSVESIFQVAQLDAHTIEHISNQESYRFHHISRFSAHHVVGTDGLVCVGLNELRYHQKKTSGEFIFVTDIVAALFVVLYVMYCVLLTTSIGSVESNHHLYVIINILAHCHVVNHQV